MLQCNAVLLTLIGYLAASCMGEISKFTPYTYVGCYAKDDLSGKLTSDKGIDTFQSQGNCWYNCDGSAIQALIGGNRCYCAGDAKILNGLQQAPDSACSEKCLGSEKCGGSKYFSVLVNNKNVNDLDFEPLGGGSYTTESSSSSSSGSSSRSSSSSSSGSSSRSSSSSSSGSSSRSSSTSTTSPTDSTTTNEPSSTATSTTQPTTTSTTIVSSKSQDTVSKDSTTTSVQVSTAVVTQSTSIYTTKHDQSMVVITSTFVVTSRPPVTSSSAPSSDTSAMSSSLRNANTSKKSNGISKGAIAGIVVGACSAVLLIVLFVLLWRRKQGGDDVSSRFDENQIYHQAYSFGHNEDIPGGATMPQAAASNGYQNGLGSRPPYPGQHSGHNYGRPRLSNHSLPDITENQALRIANPDSI